MQETMFYGHTFTKNQNVYLNLMRDLSRYNSKNYEVTTRDGHVKGLMVNLKLTAVNSGDPAVPVVAKLTAFGAPNTWKMRNSFRKFAAYRDLMFEHSGITEDEKGRYGKTMRPYLDTGHLTGTELVPFTTSSANSVVSFDGGEWTYSQFATVPLYEAGGIDMKDSTLPVTDSWPVHICEANVPEDSEDKTSGTYSSVGMIHSYNLDRQDVVTPAADNVVEGPSNPLAALIASGNQATGEILNIAEDQELELPPYDQTDDGESIARVIQGYGLNRTTGGTMSINCFVPAGILCVLSDAAAMCAIEVTVLGEVLCKDMA
jgi:hypothetical protein